MEDENFLSIFSKVIFYGVLIANSLAYLYSLLVILFFGVMVLMILLRGGQNNMSLQLDNRGMTADQMASIDTYYGVFNAFSGTTIGHERLLYAGSSAEGVTYTTTYSK